MSSDATPRVIRTLVLLDKDQTMSREQHQTLVKFMRERAPGWDIRLTNTDYCWTQHRGTFPAFTSRMVSTFDVFVRMVELGSVATCGRGSYQIAKVALAKGKRVRTWDGQTLGHVTRIDHDAGLGCYRLSLA